MNAATRLITDHIDVWTSADTEKKLGRGRSATGAGSVYGIKKLRELILELAVRGKLVPQDPNDEPASELLKRISKERNKIPTAKKDKVLESDFELTIPEVYNFPISWQSCKLGDVAEIVRGITFPGSEKSKSPDEGRIACLRTSNVQDYIEWDDILYIREEFVSRDDQYIRRNDIIMSMANSRELVGKVAIVSNNISEKTTFGGFLGVIRPHLIAPRFLLALLRAPNTKARLMDDASQTTNIANISLAKLRPLSFLLPPLAEQHRIVTKVDELMALCDQLEVGHAEATAAHEKLVAYLLDILTISENADDFAANWHRIAAHFDTLFATESSIDTLKQTILQLAVMGKLTGAVALEHNVKISELFDLLDGDRGSNYPKSSDYLEDGYCLFLSTKNVRKNGFLFNETQFISEQKHNQLRQGRLKRNDLVITTRGTLGNIAHYDQTVDYEVVRINSGMLILRPRQNQISPEFMILFVQSPNFLEQLSKKQSGSAQQQIPAGILKTFKVPLYSMDEQRCIVAKVNELMALCDNLKSRLHDANQLQQKLADVLVAQAA